MRLKQTKIPLVLLWAFMLCECTTLIQILMKVTYEYQTSTIKGVPASNVVVDKCYSTRACG